MATVERKMAAKVKEKRAALVSLPPTARNVTEIALAIVPPIACPFNEIYVRVYSWIYHILSTLREGSHVVLREAAYK